MASERTKGKRPSFFKPSAFTDVSQTEDMISLKKKTRFLSEKVKLVRLPNIYKSQCTAIRMMLVTMPYTCTKANNFSRNSRRFA